MKKPDFARLTPPGMSIKHEQGFLLGGLSASAFYSLGFLMRYISARRELYYYVGAQRRLKPDTIMPDFVELLSGSLLGFIVVAFCMLVFIALRYAYYHHGSKSIYLIQRLPDRWEMLRRCLILPLLETFSCLLTALLFILLYFAVYMLFTPDECLMPHQWQKIWSVLL